MKELRERLVFPLDFAEAKIALEWVERLKPYVGVFKIGLELFTAQGPKIVEEVKKRTEAKIFLDLKLHDIPNTIAGAVRASVSLGVDFLTVHTLSGRKALEVAVKAAQGGLKILAVTILTSLDRGDLLELGFNGELVSEPEELVYRLTLLAHTTGCDGVVTSAKEVSKVKESFPHLLAVIPGIRDTVGPQDDQLRTATPYEAILRGADYLVVGRPIREAPSPEEVCEHILSQMEKALQDRNAL